VDYTRRYHAGVVTARGVTKRGKEKYERLANTYGEVTLTA